MFWALWMACSGNPAPVDTLASEGAPAVVSAPEFAVVNHRGEPRTRDDLLGHPTVMWFFPVAGTPG